MVMRYYISNMANENDITDRADFEPGSIIASLIACGIDPFSWRVEPPDEPQNLYVGDLSDEEFGILRPYLPREPLQRGCIANKQVLDALIWASRTRRAASQVPVQYGTREAFRKRSERWGVSGVWADVLCALNTLNLTDDRRAELRAIAEREDRRGKRIIAFRSDPKATAQPPGKP
jgi:hypothetical protein